MGAWLNVRFPRCPFSSALHPSLARHHPQTQRRPRRARSACFWACPRLRLWLSKLRRSSGVSQLALVLLLRFLLYSSAMILLFVLREEIITIDTLSAAFSVFLLIGFAWGCIYGLLYLENQRLFT